jgi:hypothetical protein
MPPLIANQTLPTKPCPEMPLTEDSDGQEYQPGKFQRVGSQRHDV